jgi:ribonucleotide reductase alpha subunit
MSVIHPDYSKLAARILVSTLHKHTTSNFLEIMRRLRDYKDKVGRPAPMLADDVFDIIEKNIDKIQARIDYNRDYNYDYFGLRTLERAYLLKDGKKTIERP